MLINGKEAKDLSEFDLAEDQMIVIDDLFPQYVIEHVHDQVFNTYSWFYGHTSNYPDDPRTDVGAIPDWPEVPAFKQQKSEVWTEFERLKGQDISIKDID